MKNRHFDAIVVGAGIVGSACAWELAKSNQNVLIIEMNPVGGGATAAGMGHVVVMDDSPAQFALCHWSQRLWNDLMPILPAQAECLNSGTLWVASNDEEMEEVERKQAFNQAHGIESEILTASQVAEKEPALRKGLSGGLRVPGDSVVYPPVVAQYFVEAACQKGAFLLKGQQVKQLIEGTVILENGEELYAPVIVNACGSHASKLTPGLKMNPRKGHLLITDRYPGYVNHQLIELGYVKSAANLTEDSVAFNIQPRKTGQLLLGSSRQMGDESPEVRMEILERMIAKAEEYLPSISSLTVLRTWTGFRAATEDKLPLIGPCPWQPSVFLATGHEGLGITTSLGTARLLVDHLNNHPSEIPLDPYLPKRLRENV